MDSPMKFPEAFGRATYASVALKENYRPPSANNKLKAALNADLGIDDYINPMDIGDSVS